MKSIGRALLYAGVLTTIAWAQEFPKTPKHETLDEAIRFEKYKITSAEAQARKDAAEAAGVKRTAQTKTSKTMKSRRQGQADAAKR
jgi:hypothetical protein